MCDSRASLTVPEGKKSIFAFNGITLVECEIRPPLRLVFLGDVAVPAENQWNQRRDLGPRGGRGLRYC